MSTFSLDAERILAETLIRQIEHRPETASTNDLAIELVNAGRMAVPLLTIADRQTQGRGRGENRWWSTPGSLTFTVVVDAQHHQVPTHSWPKLSLTVGLAVCEALEKVAPDRRFQLKWPNDVFLEHRKVCGVLVETIATRPGLIVIGLGINVNNSFADAPHELQSIATSLVDVCQRHFERGEVLLQVLRQLEDCVQRVAKGAPSLSEAWRSRCLLEGRTLTVEAGNRQLTGVCQGIDDEGALLLQAEGGIQRCVAGAISRIL